MKLANIDFGEPNQLLNTEEESLTNCIKLYKKKIQFVKICTEEELSKARNEDLFCCKFCSLCTFNSNFEEGYRELECENCIITKKGNGKHGCTNTPYDKIHNILVGIQCAGFNEEKRNQLLSALKEELKFLESLKY